MPKIIYRIKLILATPILLVWWLSFGWLLSDFFPKRLEHWMGPRAEDKLLGRENSRFKLLVIAVVIALWWAGVPLFIKNPNSSILNVADILTIFGISAGAYIALITHFIDPHDKKNFFTNTMLERTINLRTPAASPSWM